MIDQLLEKLLITHDGENAYTIKGDCNQGATPQISRGGNLILPDKDLMIDVEGVSSNDNLHFEYPSATFSGTTYGRRDSLYIVFGDHQGKVKAKGGVVIRDSNYPPPYSAPLLIPYDHEEFTKKFNIEEIECVRQGSTATFDINIKVSYSGSLILKNKGADYLEDPDRDGPIKAIVLKLEKDESGVYSADYSFSLNNEELMNDNSIGKDIPIIICMLVEGDIIPWDIFTHKKGTVFIYS